MRTLFTKTGTLHACCIMLTASLFAFACINRLPYDDPNARKQEQKTPDNNGNTEQTNEPAPAESVPTEGDDRLLTQENNLLFNGNCELWNLEWEPYEVLESWSRHGNMNMRQEAEIVSEGQYSAKLSATAKGATAVLNQRVEVTPGSRIRIRLQYYISQWKAKGARMYCYFRSTRTQNLSAQELKDTYDSKTLQIIRGGGYGLAYFPAVMHEWQTFDYIITVPQTACYFVFEIHSYYDTTIYIDDCFVVSLDTTEAIHSE